MDRQMLADGGMQRIGLAAAHGRDDKHRAAVVDRHLAALAERRRQAVEMRFRPFRDDPADRRRDHAARQRQQPRAQHEAGAVDLAHHAMRLERVQDPVHGRARHAGPLGEPLERQAGRNFLELAQHRHHALDGGIAMRRRLFVFGHVDSPELLCDGYYMND
jgi:hypothetical protein